MKSQQKFVHGLLIIIVFTGLFGLASYFINNQIPPAQKTVKPVHSSVQTKAIVKTPPTGKGQKILEKPSQAYQNALYQVYRLQTELKATKNAYQKSLQVNDSLKRLVGLLQRPGQKAEIGHSK